MKLIRLAIMAVWALVGCGGEPGEDEDPVEWGHDAQSIVTRSSASGARTWGSKPVFVSPVNTQPSCTKTTTGNCFFFANPPPGGAATTIKVRVLSAGFTSSQVTFLNGVVDTWVSNMRTLTSSSQTPMSFSRAVSGENVQIVSNDLGGATSSKYNRYAFPDLSQCTALIPTTKSPAGEAVTATYNRCAFAVVKFDITDLNLYTAAQGYTSGQQNVAITETIMHALDLVVGIGEQSANSGFVSYTDMAKTSKSFLSNEETCRLNALRTLDPFEGDPLSPQYFGISSTTCSN
jgi:hypothetical protein